VTLDPLHCVTCSDTAVTGVVVDVDGETATVSIENAYERVGIELVWPVRVGDTLICHAGIALARVET
jgi:hydrogenase maturation factor